MHFKGKFNKVINVFFFTIILLVIIYFITLTGFYPNPVNSSEKAPSFHNRVIPIGTILAWDNTIRDSSGNPTGKTRKLPYGWAICDGKNGTPNLVNHFLRGAISSGIFSGSDSGSTGYRDGGVDLNAHKHEVPINNIDNVGWAAVGAPWGTSGNSGDRHVAPFMGNGQARNSPWKLTNKATKINLNQHTHSSKNVPKHYTVIYIMKLK